jgi:ubiquinone/menaquinone biosynthesis C-methylase UbiE
MKHQEVLTPPELLKEIYKHLKPEDLKGNILDPCVGTGNMIKPFLNLMAKGKGPKSVTMVDIQEDHCEDLERYCKEIGL